MYPVVVGVAVCVALAGCPAGEGGAGTTDDATGDTTSKGTPLPTTSGESTTETTTTTTDSTETTATADPSETSPPPDMGEVRRCNGHAALCDRAFDAVTFPCTHNAYAALDDGFSQLSANQKFGLQRQLEDGVRCMMLDVYADGDETVLCHGNCNFGQVDHLQALQIIHAFLGEHPDEVFTIIYEDHAPTERLVADLETSGLASLVYTHQDGPWPSLAAMIDGDTRVVVTAESGGPPPAWFHHVWDVTWDTPYTFQSVDEFTCALNRGDPDNDLYLVNHWISSLINTPSAMDAPVANSFAVLHGRAEQCRREAGQQPNFLAVDFYDKGDLFAVVDAMNDVD